MSPIHSVIVRKPAQVVTPEVARIFVTSLNQRFQMLVCKLRPASGVRLLPPSLLRRHGGLTVTSDRFLKSCFLDCDASSRIQVTLQKSLQRGEPQRSFGIPPASLAHADSGCQGQKRVKQKWVLRLWPF